MKAGTSITIPEMILIPVKTYIKTDIFTFKNFFLLYGYEKKNFL